MGYEDRSVVEEFIKICSLDRGIHASVVRRLLCEFLRCLHEAEFKSGYITDYGSVINQVYRSLGAEAVYHLCGLLANSGKGHDAETVYTALDYQDSRAKRFGTITDRWQIECDGELSDRDET